MVVEVQPPSAGIPEQWVTGSGSVALWYSNGTRGVVKVWACNVCLGSGLRRRYGFGDVHALVEWERARGITLAEPRHTRIRGMVVGPGGVRELDAVAGELRAEIGTALPDEATTIAMPCAS